MIANELKDGQTFKLVHRVESKYNTLEILQCVDENRPADWMRYPGIVYQNTETGLFGGLGGANEIVLCDAPVLATEKQIAYLNDLGYTGKTNISQKVASKLIDGLKPSCHYCGMPAVKMNFFDVHVCANCG